MSIMRLGSFIERLLLWRAAWKRAGGAGATAKRARLKARRFDSDADLSRPSS
jgi:hypothetical protein